MRLTVATPLAIVVDTDDVVHVRAEDESGAFGILPEHAPFVTALAVSVLTWRDAAGDEHHVAARGGVLTVERSHGTAISVASREAVVDDDLERLETRVLADFRRTVEREQAARGDARRLYLAAIRQILRYLRPERAPDAPESAGVRAASFEP